MILESLLAFFHFSAILMVVVFLSSEGALCRAEWLNEAVLKRLKRVDLIYLVSLALVLLTGLARIKWGAKGSEWYWSQPLMHLKLTLFAVSVVLAIPVSRAIRRWYRIWERTGQLPVSGEIRKTRTLIMISAHIIMLVPLAAVFLARGMFAVG
ncbi:MAG: DUF2214 family protein [Lautropia sp.]|nr:DUF2214 family protein [Lautropia sp.]